MQLIIWKTTLTPLLTKLEDFESSEIKSYFKRVFGPQLEKKRFIIKNGNKKSHCVTTTPKVQPKLKVKTKKSQDSKSFEGLGPWTDVTFPMIVCVDWNKMSNVERNCMQKRRSVEPTQRLIFVGDWSTNLNFIFCVFNFIFFPSKETFLSLVCTDTDSAHILITFHTKSWATGNFCKKYDEY